jgi:hypothetical protein
MLFSNTRHVDWDAIEHLVPIALISTAMKHDMTCLTSELTELDAVLAASIHQLCGDIVILMAGRRPQLDLLIVVELPTRFDDFFKKQFTFM